MNGSTKRVVTVMGALAALASLAACVGATEDSLTGAPASTSTSSATEPPPGEDDDAATAEPTDAGPGSDAPKPDAKPDAARPTNAFEGAPAFVATTGPGTRKAGHSFNNNTPPSNPAGRPCLNCHGATGDAPKFAAAGTVYAGTAPAAGVEVRAVGADGVSFSAYTNADGNFFFRAPGAPIVFPAMLGVRNGKGMELMIGTSQQGNCNACHSVAGGAGRMFITP